MIIFLKDKKKGGWEIFVFRNVLSHQRGGESWNSRWVGRCKRRGSVSAVMLVWMLCLFGDDLPQSLGVKDGTFFEQNMTRSTLKERRSGTCQNKDRS